MSKTAIITVGRMNPATSAHSIVVERIAKEAKRRNGDGFIYLTKTQDTRKNPLTYDQKLKWAKKSNPKYASMFVKSSAKNPFEVFTEVYDKGYTELVIVVGSDRVGEFQAMATKYNGEKARHGFYEFENIEVISAGERDPDAEGAKGMSASKLRSLAVDGNFKQFAKGVSPALSDKEKEQYYQDVRSGMKISESLKRFREYLTEKVGVSTFDKVISGALVLSPKALEQAFGGPTEITGWHSTDISGLEKLLKIQGQRKSISIMTKLHAAVVYGLQTEGGVVAQVTGSQLYKSYADLSSKRTKQGLRVIDYISLPDDVQRIIDSVWRQTVQYGMKELIKKVEKFESKENIEKIKNVYSLAELAKPTDRKLVYMVQKLFRPDESNPASKFRYSSYKSTKLIPSVMKSMVARYVDLLEDNIWEVEELFKQGVEKEHMKSGTNVFEQWNEVIVNRIKIQKIVFIQELLDDQQNVEQLKKSSKYDTETVGTVDEFMAKFSTNEETQLIEKVTKSDLDQVEKYADKLFAKVGIDVEFTRHFLDRVNDERNRKPISTAELIRIFRETFKKYGKLIPQLGSDAQAVLRDMKTDINVPFVLNVDKKGELDLVSKTIMRKKGFKTSNQVFAFESELTKSLKRIAEGIVYDK